MYRFPFFIIHMARFSMPNSIPMPWLYILTAYWQEFPILFRLLLLLSDMQDIAGEAEMNS